MKNNTPIQSYHRSQQVRPRPARSFRTRKTSKRQKLAKAIISILIALAIPAYVALGNLIVESSCPQPKIETVSVPCYARSYFIPTQEKEVSRGGIRTITMEATGYYEGNITSTGIVPVAYRTAAVDPAFIPYGTRFTVDAFPGVIWTAEDCGNHWDDAMNANGTHYLHIRGDRVDLRLPDRASCFDLGRRELEVRILE